jgi:hypothetical protein
MPYPESCPECGGAFRNTGTHFTARRNEIGRHVLLELGCQNTTRRFWWDFTTGSLTDEGRPSPIRRPISVAVGAASATNGVHHPGPNGHVSDSNSHALLSTLHVLAPIAAADPVAVSDHAPLSDEAQQSHDVPVSEDAQQSGDALVSGDAQVSGPVRVSAAAADPLVMSDDARVSTSDANPSDSFEAVAAAVEDLPLPAVAQEETLITQVAEPTGPPPVATASLKDAFVRQLQLDRLTLRQMRSWLMSDEARRAIEVAAGATEATYERLALILFGVELPQLLGKEAVVTANTGMSAEERLELQREKARIRARLRRAAAKAARQEN